MLIKVMGKFFLFPPCKNGDYVVMFVPLNITVLPVYLIIFTTLHSFTGHRTCSVFTCDCDDEWAGPSCEFESENRDHGYENCTLPCNNGGQCRKGVKDMSLISGLGPELSQLIDESTHSENFEHCVCPDGFTGLQCQHEYAGCGNGEHICLHGSTCVPPTDPLNPVWSCDCAEPFREDQAYIGKFCQHHHTTVCTSSSMEDEPFQGSSNLVVCVNDGVCTQIVENGIR